jgi:hypothetical protein
LLEVSTTIQFNASTNFAAGTTVNMSSNEVRNVAPATFGTSAVNLNQLNAAAGGNGSSFITVGGSMIAWGTTGGTGGGVTYPNGGFTAQPSVNATASGGTLANIRVHIASVSSSGCTIAATGGANTIYWIAVGPK